MRRAGTLATVAVAAVTLAGCGSAGGHLTGGRPGPAKDTPASPLEAVNAAYTATTKAKTAKIAPDTTVRAQEHTVHSSGAGVMDLGGRKMTLTMTLPNGQSQQMRMTDGKEYVEMPPQTRAQLPHHARWLAVDLDKVAKQRFGASLSQLRGKRSVTHSLAYLRDSSKVTKLDEKTIRGVSTTGYKVVVNLDKAAKQRKNAATRKAIHKVEKMLGSHSMPVKVWLDKQHRVRREAVSIPVHLPKGGKATTDTTTDLYGFGTPLHVKVPPESQTISLSELRSR
ncbi:MAG: hypothetical protein ACRDN9_04620 [Streptosporangiaceae bacterium]